jgi:hypothetical protein
MRQKSETTKVPSEQVVKDIRRASRKQYSVEEKIRIVLDDLPANTASRNCAGAKGSPRASTSAGRRGY